MPRHIRADSLSCGIGGIRGELSERGKKPGDHKSIGPKLGNCASSPNT